MKFIFSCSRFHSLWVVLLQAGTIALHWSDSESLYESALTKVPVGKYKCQLAVGGDIIPIDEFDITENSDTVYVIPAEEEEEEEGLLFFSY